MVLPLTATPATVPTRWLAPAVTLAITVTLIFALAAGTIGIGLGIPPAAAVTPAPASGPAVVPQLDQDTVVAALTYTGARQEADPFAGFPRDRMDGNPGEHPVRR